MRHRDGRDVGIEQQLGQQFAWAVPDGRIDGAGQQHQTTASPRARAGKGIVYPWAAGNGAKSNEAMTGLRDRQLNLDGQANDQRPGHLRRHGRWQSA